MKRDTRRTRRVSKETAEGWKERCQGRVRRGRGRGHRRARRRRRRPDASPTAAEREWRDLAPATRLESNAGTRSRRDRLARSAAAKKRSRRPSLRRVKISERRDAAASGESGGRWSGTWCGAVARASRVSIDTTFARSPIDRDASRGPRGGTVFGEREQIWRDLSAIESGPITTRETHRRSWG